MSSRKYSRRDALARTGGAVLTAALGAPFCLAAGKKSAARARAGAVAGEEAGARAGEAVLADGGNAIDAAVAAALTSCVAAPARCGIGGYGGHMVIALAGGRKVTAIDFNTVAAAAASAAMFSPNEKGEVRDRLNYYGWLAAGVPGTLAGLQLALARYGTRPFRQLVQPAIAVAREGFVIAPSLGAAIAGAAGRFRKDPASAKLYFKNDQPLAAGETLRNPDLADLLSTLASRNSVDSFYRGDIARRIAEGFQKNGGLITVKDLAAYRAREVKPLRLKWDDFDIFAAPLTAGGFTVLEALAILQAVGLDSLTAPARAQARLEALRLAWKDRLELLGDPENERIPIERLLSVAYAREQAAKIAAAVKERKPVAIQIRKHLDEGTCHVSSVDAQGNMAAVTFTHGSTFGAQVTVDGLGLTLGHGMWVFDPNPGQPNSPGPGKRPLNNMCPSVVLRGGQPVLAVGGAGGVKIPGALYSVLTQFVGQGADLETAIAAPRSYSTGTLEVTAEKGWPEADADYLKQVGFKVRTGENANVGAVSFDPKTGECRGARR